MKKIGHTGTLDPDAERCSCRYALGKGTKLVDLLTDKEKTYEAVLHLGIDTDTQDMYWNSSGREAGECDRGGSAERY